MPPKTPGDEDDAAAVSAVWNSGDREYGGRNDYDHANARSLAQNRPLSRLG